MTVSAAVSPAGEEDDQMDNDDEEGRKRRNQAPSNLVLHILH